MPHFGRRTIFVYGLAVLFVTLLTIGFLGLAPGNTSALWAVGAMLLVYTFVYDITSEFTISSTRSSVLLLQSALLKPFADSRRSQSAPLPTASFLRWDPPVFVRRRSSSHVASTTVSFVDLCISATPPLAFLAPPPRPN